MLVQVFVSHGQPLITRVEWVIVAIFGPTEDWQQLIKGYIYVTVRITKRLRAKYSFPLCMLMLW